MFKGVPRGFTVIPGGVTNISGVSGVPVGLNSVSDDLKRLRGVPEGLWETSYYQNAKEISVFLLTLVVH